MANIVASVALVIGLLCVLAHNFALYGLYKLIELERPDWVAVRGSLDVFYRSLPRAWNPNVSLAVLKVVFSSKRQELQSPTAAKHVQRIRVCLPLGLACFVLVGLIDAWLGA
jgi:hypothetical protein